MESTTGARGRSAEHSHRTKPRASRGRPSKLTAEVIEILATSLERGDSLEGASAAAGISRSTLSNWLRRGARALEELCPIDPANSADKEALSHEALYAELFGRVRLALARAEAENLRVIEEAGRGGARITETVRVVDKDGAVVKETTTTKQAPAQWKAAAWRLERLYPDKYGGKDRGGSGGGSLTVEIVEDAPPVRDGKDEDRPMEKSPAHDKGGGHDG